MTTFSLILPCFNEARRLPAALAAYLAHLPDGPRPGSRCWSWTTARPTPPGAAVAAAVAARDARVRVLRTWPNHGKGSAVRTGMLAGDRRPPGLRRRRRLLRSGGAQPGGCRARRRAGRHRGSPGEGPAHALPVPPGRQPRLQRRPAAWSLACPSATPSAGSRASSGRRPAWSSARARLDGFAFDAEVLLLARQLGLAIAEVPVRARERGGSKVHLLLDGRRMLAELWAVRRAADTDPDSYLLRRLEVD